MLAHSRTPPPQASRRLCTAGLSKLPAEAARVERPRKWRRTSAKLRCIHCCLADAAWAACMRDGDDRPHAARQEPAPGSQGSSRLLPHFERPTSTAKQKDAKLGNKKTARLIHRWHTLGPRRGMAGRSMTPHTSATCAAAVPTDPCGFSPVAAADACGAGTGLQFGSERPHQPAKSYLYAPSSQEDDDEAGSSVQPLQMPNEACSHRAPRGMTTAVAICYTMTVQNDQLDFSSPS